MSDLDIEEALFEAALYNEFADLLRKRGNVVEATQIAAPSFTNSKDGEREPLMHQTRKGSNYYFGMKAHIGTDVGPGLVHTVVSTPANVNDVTQAGAVANGEETDVFADAGYRGVAKRKEEQGLDKTWHFATRRPRKRRV